MRCSGRPFRHRACARSRTAARAHSATRRSRGMTSSEHRWYVVQSQPNAELKAVAHLNRQGFVTYLPRYLKRRRHARRVDIVAAPLFPCYLFVAIDMTATRWRSIYSTVGVSRMVCSGDLPTPIPNQIVTTLKAREDASGLVHLEHQPSRSRSTTRCSAAWSPAPPS